MKTFLLSGVLCSILLGVSAVFDIFNCNRPSQSCVAGPCTSGSCDCTGLDRQGYKCQDDTTDTDGTGCGGGCTTCMPGDVCLCADDKYNGALKECEYNRIQLICSVEGKMIINAHLEGANNIFVGTEANCPLDGTAGAGNIPAGWQGFMREISTPTDGSCAPIDVNTVGGVTTTCVTARVRYGASYWDALDGKIQFCCAGTTVSSITVADLTADDELVQGTTVEPAGDQTDIAVAVKEGGAAVVNPLTVGDSVTVEFRLATDANFVELQPLECSLQNLEVTPGLTNALVTGGCDTGFSDATMAVGSPSGYDLTFTAIKYVGFAELFVVCDVRLCTVMSECTASCPARKRREAPSNVTEGTTQTLIVPLKVEDPFQENKIEAEVENAVTKATNINLSAAVIGLAVVALLLLAVCLFLAVCLINRRRESHLKA